jgi:molecular chaperone GrpE (heat shock protein)
MSEEPEAPPDQDAAAPPADDGEPDGAEPAEPEPETAAAPEPEVAPVDQLVLVPAEAGTEESVLPERSADPGEPGPVPAAAVQPQLDVTEVVAQVVAGVEAALTPVVDALGQIAARIGTLDALEARVAEVARLGDRHNQIIDELHRENQKLRQGELTQAIAPLFRDLIRLNDQLAQLDESSESPGASDAALAARQVAEILGRAGVDRFDVEPGEPFDATRHQGIGRTPTDDPALDGAVAAVRRSGYVTSDGRVLRAAEVEVHRFVAVVDAAGPEPAPDPPPAPEPSVPEPAEPVPAEPQPVLPEPVPADPIPAPAVASDPPASVAVPPPDPQGVS